MTSKEIARGRLNPDFRLAAVVLSMLILACLLVTPIAPAEETAAQQVFPSPGAAASALVAAGKADDLKTLSSVLGPDADQVLASGDPVADKNARNVFVRRFHDMHRLAHHVPWLVHL